MRSKYSRSLFPSSLILAIVISSWIILENQGLKIIILCRKYHLITSDFLETTVFTNKGVVNVVTIDKTTRAAIISSVNSPNESAEKAIANVVDNWGIVEKPMNRLCLLVNPSVLPPTYPLIVFESMSPETIVIVSSIDVWEKKTDKSVCMPITRKNIGMKK